MNNGCNWFNLSNCFKLYFPLHLLLSATILFTFCFPFIDTQLTATAAELTEIQRRGYLIAGVKDNSPPLGFKDATGTLQGLEIDLSQHLAQDLLGKSTRVKLLPLKNKERISSVLNNQVDIAIARVTATESRARLVSFSIPYYIDATALITSDSSLKRLADFKNRKIAVLNSSSTIARLKYFIPNANLIGVDSYQQGFTSLENNTISAFAADGSVLAGWKREHSQYNILPIKLSTEPLSVVIPKGLQYESLRQKVNESIARYLADNWLQQRASYWGLSESKILTK
jgi:polar amino acid transport system substrate-binding protein